MLRDFPRRLDAPASRVSISTPGEIVSQLMNNLPRAFIEQVVASSGKYLANRGVICHYREDHIRFRRNFR